MAAAFVLMLVSLGSVVVAATCVLLDLLSVAAAYGVMTAIFVARLGGERWWARTPWARSSRGSRCSCS